MTSAVARDQEKNMDFWYSSEKWKDVLEAEETATICVPPCLDVLKTWKRNDLDEAPYLAPNISGQKGEAAFMLKFQELKLGGILVSGLESCDLVASRTVPKKIIQKGEWDAIFFHQTRGIFVIEVKATEVNDENTVNKRMEKVKIQLDRNIKNIQQSFLSLYLKECTCINGFICFPFRNEDRDNYEGYKIIDMSALNDHAVFRKFFEPQTNETKLEVSLLKSFVAEFVCCRSKVEFHSQAYNAMQVATWIMEQDLAQKQDPRNLANISGNGPSGKIILTAQQLEIVECREKCVTIRGAPGSGKTLILMLRALEAAMENKAGSVFVFVNEKLKAKYEHFFFEERAKTFVDDSNNIDRRPKVQTIDKIDFAKSEDDVFFDETPVEDSYIEKVESRMNCSGRTTVVFTGLYIPGEAVASFRLYQPRLREFKHFELMKVLRGTGNIFGKWEHYYPLGITIGHSIHGVAVKNDNLDSFEQVQNEIANKIATLISKNINNTDLPSLKKEHIAVITCDDNDSNEMRNYFDTKEIPCGQVNEQARKLKSTSIVAVDVYLNTPSYEWPIVFIVLKPGVTKEEVLPIAASRCIANLSIFTYKNLQATTASSKTDELESTEEEIFIKPNQTSLISPSSSSQSNTEDRQQILKTQTDAQKDACCNRKALLTKKYTYGGAILLFIYVAFIVILLSYELSGDAATLSSTRQALSKMYSEKFSHISPLSQIFTFDIKINWIDLTLKLDGESTTTDVYVDILNKAFAKDVKMLIVEGAPAMGKTTLLRRIAYEWANKRKLFRFDLIVYAEFRGVQRNQTFQNIADLVIEYNKNLLENDTLKGLQLLLSNTKFCKERKILLLLDGYDESSLDKQCEELTNYLSGETIIKPLVFNILLTTRPGYLSKHRGKKGRFVFADILGFKTPEQKEKYILKHFESNKTNRTKQIAVVNDLLKNNRNLNKLAETPLLLTFICLVHERITDGTIAELYYNIIWWLIDRHQKKFLKSNVPASLGFKSNSSDKILTIQDHFLQFPELHSLGKMALNNIRKDTFEKYDFEKFHLKQIIMDVGLLIKEEKRNDYGKVIITFFFPHRTIQEFLAACYCLCSNDSTNEWLLPNTNLNPSKMNEFERFLFRIALSDNMPIQTEKRKYYFDRITAIDLDIRFDAFSTRAGFNNELLNRFLSQCKNVQSTLLRGELSVYIDAGYVVNGTITLNQYPTHPNTCRITLLSFSNLMKLPSVSFRECTFEANSKLSFSHLTKLHSLSFEKCTFEANSQLSFTNCPSLKKLKFDRCEMESSTIVGIATLPAIDTVQFSYCKIDLATWQSITDQISNSNVSYLQLTFGKDLRGKGDDFNKEFLVHLQKCSNVEMEITIEGYTIRQNDLLSFSDLTKLHSLTFGAPYSGCIFSANSELSFTNCPSLKKLKFYDCKMKSSTVFGIATLPAIDTMQFQDCSIDLVTWQSITDQISNSNVSYLQLTFESDFNPEFLIHLQKCNNVEQMEITIYDYTIRPNDLLSFSDLAKLNTLTFLWCTFAAFSQLSFTNCSSLKNLKFFRGEMESNTIVGIATLPAIDTVQFDRCTIDLATWQSITDQISNSNVKYLPLTFGKDSQGKGEDFNKEFLIHLQKCNNVEKMEITIERYEIRQNDLLSFSGLIKLSSLEFHGYTFSANSQLSFTNCPSLKTLKFNSCTPESTKNFGIATLPAIDTVQFNRCDITSSTWQSITDQISNSNVTSLHLSADFFVNRNYAVFLHHLLKCERIQQIHIKDDRDNSCDYSRNRDIWNYKNAAEDQYSSKYFRDYFFLKCNEESVTENLVLTAQKLPALTSIIISDEDGKRLHERRRLSERNRERIEKAGQERNSNFSIKYVEDPDPELEE